MAEVWYVSALSAKGFTDNIEYAMKDRYGHPVYSITAMQRRLEDAVSANYTRGIEEMWWCTTEILEAARLEGDTPDTMHGIMNRLDGMCEAIAIMTMPEVYFLDEDGDGAFEAMSLVQAEAKKRHDLWLTGFREHARKEEQNAHQKQQHGEGPLLQG